MRRTTDYRKTAAFFIATFLLVLISAFFITATVLSQSNIGQQELENYYRQQEKQLLNQTKEQLRELGYANSGVTLTRVVDEAGDREYTFTIHHGKIDRMSEKERADLAELLACNIPITENCSFYHEFLMYE